MANRCRAFVNKDEHLLMHFSSAAIARLFLMAVLGTLTVWSLRNHPISVAELTRRVPRCVAGLACFGFGITLFVKAKLGLGPWDVFHGGLAKKIGLPIGLVVNLVGLVILPLWIPLKVRVGLGTVLNTLVIGLVLDLTSPLVKSPSNIVVRWTFVIVGLLIIAVGSGMYIGAGLGAGPRDGVMMGLRRFGLSVRTARTLIEVATMGLGYLLGGKLGLATVVFMVGIGPLVQIALRYLSLPALPISEKPITR
jgi:uncharacterized membrane protein YczE